LIIELSARIKAIRLNPNYAGAWINRGKLSLSRAIWRGYQGIRWEHQAKSQLYPCLAGKRPCTQVTQL